MAHSYSNHTLKSSDEDCGFVGAGNPSLEIQGLAMPATDHSEPLFHILGDSCVEGQLVPVSPLLLIGLLAILGQSVGRPQ